MIGNVGFVVVLQQTPRALTALEPIEETVPPLVAAEAVMPDNAVVAFTVAPEAFTV
jgi:hypothetical protein